jgi:hypothetical protein
MVRGLGACRDNGPYPRARSMNILPLRKRPAWSALEAHHREVKGLHLRQLFAGDPELASD